MCELTPWACGLCGLASIMLVSGLGPSKDPQHRSDVQTSVNPGSCCLQLNNVFSGRFQLQHVEHVRCQACGKLRPLVVTKA